MPKRKIIKFQLEFYEDQRYELMAYHHFIQQQVNKGNKIPARIIKKYLSFFTMPIYHKEYDWKKKEGIIIRAVMVRFISSKCVFDLNKNGNNYCFPKMIIYAVEKTARVIKLNKTAFTKDDIVKYIHKFIIEYLGNSYKIRPYHLGYIVAFIAIQFGFKLTTRKLTNDSLFGSVRNTLKLKKGNK